MVVSMQSLLYYIDAYEISLVKMEFLYYIASIYLDYLEESSE